MCAQPLPCSSSPCSRPRPEPAACRTCRLAPPWRWSGRRTPRRCSPTAACSSPAASARERPPSRARSSTTLRRGRSVPTGQMTGVRSGHTATLLKSGLVLIAGGFDDEAPVRTAELYDPATGRFERTGSLTEPRGGATATPAARRTSAGRGRLRRRPQPRECRPLRPAQRSLLEDGDDARGRVRPHGDTSSRRPGAGDGRRKPPGPRRALR